MKNLSAFGILLFFILSTASCGGEAADKQCGVYNGNTLYLGPKGGCYYKNSSGNKEYVDRNLCKC